MPLRTLLLPSAIWQLAGAPAAQLPPPPPHRCRRLVLLPPISTPLCMTFPAASAAAWCCRTGGVPGPTAAVAARQGRRRQPPRVVRRRRLVLGQAGVTQRVASQLAVMSCMQRAPGDEPRCTRRSVPRCTPPAHRAPAPVQEASYDGVLGGFGFVSDYDISDSRALLLRVGAASWLVCVRMRANAGALTHCTASAADAVTAGDEAAAAAGGGGAAAADGRRWVLACSTAHSSAAQRPPTHVSTASHARSRAPAARVQTAVLAWAV